MENNQKVSVFVYLGRIIMAILCVIFDSIYVYMSKHGLWHQFKYNLPPQLNDVKYKLIVGHYIIAPYLFGMFLYLFIITVIHITHGGLLEYRNESVYPAFNERKLFGEKKKKERIGLRVDRQIAGESQFTDKEINEFLELLRYGEREAERKRKLEIRGKKQAERRKAEAMRDGTYGQNYRPTLEEDNPEYDFYKHYKRNPYY